MKTKKFILFLFLMILPRFAFSQCEILIWEDAFDGTEINTKIWNVLDDNSGGGNAELQYYTSRPENVYIENGCLVLKALKENYEDKKFTSGKVTTRYHSDWRYGRIEASIKLPEGQGIWPAFWMMPSESVYGEWPKSGEIDIMELIGQDPSTVYGTLHFGPPYNYTNGLYGLASGKFSDGFFKFSIDWTPDSIRWMVNDEVYSKKTVADMDEAFQWNAFQERFYVILNLAVGGNWPGPPNAETVFPQTMTIDYVRVYGDPSEQEIHAIDSAYANAKNVTYTFTNIPGATFNWTVPAGVTILEGQGTNEIMVDWGCDPGTISLDVSNIACADQHYDLPVAFSKLTIAGDSVLFPLEPAIFSVPELNGTSYTWTYPSDVVLEGTADDSISLTWGCSSGYLKVVAANSCGSEKDSLLIKMDEPVFSGPSNVSQFAAGMVYSITLQPSSTYSWSVPEGTTIVEGDGTNSIVVDFTDQGGDVVVTVTNSCGTKTYTITVSISDTIILADYETTFLDFLTFAETTFTVVGNPAADNVNPSLYVGESFKSTTTWAGIYADLGFELRFVKHDKFSVKVLGPKAGEVLFKIEDIVSSGSKADPIQVSSSYTNVNAWEEVTFDFPDAADATYDRVALFFDFGSDVPNTYYFDDILQLPKDFTSAGITEKASARVWPNPFTDDVRISVPSDAGGYMITVYDLQGRLLYRTENTVPAGSDQRISLSGLENGMYLLSVSYKNSNYSTLISKE